MRYLEDIINQSSLSSKDIQSCLSKFSFIESNPILTSIPEIVKEGVGLSILKDTLSKDSQVDTRKLDDIKSKLLPVRAQTAIDPSAILKQKSLLNDLKSNDKDLTKNIALGTQRLQPKALNKFGLTENQLDAKNKLDILTKSKTLQKNDDEINQAFSRINEKMKGNQGVNKLFSGIESSNENLSFTQLSDKLKKSSNKDLLETKTPSTEQSFPKFPKEENKEDENIIKELVSKKESKENLERISSIDQKQLFKRTDSIIKEKRSDKHLINLNKDES